MTPGLSVAFLIGANLLPLIGVLAWDWDVFLLLLLFWCENVIIGLFGIARIIVCGSERSVGESLLLPLFFLVHYGGFMFGHFMVLFALYSGAVDDGGRHLEPADYLAMVLDRLHWVPVVALFISHGWSFVENFMGGREHERLSPSQAMALPYRRVFITHIALIAGGFFLVEKGQPVIGLFLLVMMKIAFDLALHKKEHERLTGSARATQTQSGFARK